MFWRTCKIRMKKALLESLFWYSNRLSAYEFAKPFLNIFCMEQLWDTTRETCNFIEIETHTDSHRHRCFPMNFAKFLRTTIYIEQLRWLLLDYFFIKIDMEESTLTHFQPWSTSIHPEIMFLGGLEERYWLKMG